MPRASRLVGVAVVLGLLAAACGRSDDDDDAVAIAASATPPDSMAAWEALWARQRDAVVARITAEGLGRSADGRTLVGPAGFSIDLTTCPEGWSDTEGLSDTEIKIGQTMPQSGPAADYGNVGRAMAAVFDHYSAQGAFTDSTGKRRGVTYLTRDDSYDPARTIPLTDELIDSERVFAVSTLGTANALKTYDKLNRRCIPQPFVLSGHPAWGDPVNHPWTSGLSLAYTTEAVLWGAFIDQRIDGMAPGGGDITVASIVSNNDFGRTYDVGFEAYLAQSPNRDRITYVSETVEPTAPTITDPMTTLAARQPDVFIAMVFSSYCTQAVTQAAQNGMHDSADVLFQPSVCPGTTYVKKEAVGADGVASEGWWQVNTGLKEINDPSQYGDPFIAWAREQLTARGIDPRSSSTLGSGINFVWAWVQALRIAGQLPGGLSRTNFILAVRSMDMTHPYLLPGIRFVSDGNRDAYPQEGGVFQRWDADAQVWEVDGEVIDLSGRSKLCVYDVASGLCKGD